MKTVGFMAVVQVALILKCSNFLSGILKVTNMAKVCHSTNILLGHCLYDNFVPSHSFASHGDPKLPNPEVQLHSINDKSDSLATGGNEFLLLQGCIVWWS